MKKKITSERLVLLISIGLNIFQVVSDEAQEWVAISQQSSPNKQMVLNIEEPDSMKIERAFSVK